MQLKKCEVSSDSQDGKLSARAKTIAENKMRRYLNPSFISTKILVSWVLIPVTN